MPQRFNPTSGIIENYIIPKDGRHGQIGPIGPRGLSGERGPAGAPGKNGDPGAHGKPGQNGKDGNHGIDGKHGRDGQNGKDGKHGTNGTQIHFTNGRPGNEIGVHGDIAITLQRDLFRKIDNQWSPHASFVIGGGGGGRSIRKLQNIPGVSISNPTVGDILVFDGAGWSNQQEDILSTYKVHVDKVSEGLTYIGYASPGVADSAQSWRVKKIVTTGENVDITFADGNLSFDNIWDNRASLTYS